MNLLEQYSKRIAVSEAFYKKANKIGTAMDTNRKLAVAKCLDNTAKYLNEAFASSSAVQRSDIGAFKKFCLDLVTLAVPNLIAHELVIVHPMSSMSGFVSYINYTKGTTKGASTQGDLVNNPFKLGNVDVNYTSQKVVEAKAAIEASEITAKRVERTLSWKAVVPGYVQIINGSLVIVDKGDGKLYKGLTADYTPKTDSNGNVTNITYTGTGTEVGTIDYATGAIVLGDGTAIDAAITATAVTVNYVYDNVTVPQNELPTINAHIESIPLFAKARRIAIYYSQLAEFQFKSEYGQDLNKNLSEQALGQLAYEIDTEITQMLIDNAVVDSDLTFSKAVPQGVYASKQEHYAFFAEKIEIGKQKIYDATKRFAPNYMLIASDILPVLAFVPGFQAATVGQMNGPYYAGSLNGLKVFVTPNITPGKFVIGVNGADMMSSAAVYAPYLPVIPTQLIQFADGMTSEGFSTLYDCKMLNKDLLISGAVTD